MKIKSNGNILLVYMVILLIVGTGWTMNIIKLSECDFEAPYKAEVIYTVGLIPIVGMVTGWLNIKDGVEK